MLFLTVICFSHSMGKCCRMPSVYLRITCAIIISCSRFFFILSTSSMIECSSYACLSTFIPELSSSSEGSYFLDLAVYDGPQSSDLQ